MLRSTVLLTQQIFRNVTEIFKKISVLTQTHYTQVSVRTWKRAKTIRVLDQM